MHTGSRLAPITATDLARVNQAIESGRLQDGLGTTIDTPVTAGLINEDATKLYAVVDGVVQMMAEECFDLAPLGLDKLEKGE